MAELQKVELIAFLLQRLSSSPYACSSLSQISGGTVNYLFRGTLHQPLVSEVGSVNETVIVKFSRNALSSNPSFKLDESRCTFENAMMMALADLPTNNTETGTPRCHYFIRDKNIQVIEDLHGTFDLQSIPDTSSDSYILPEADARSLGRHLGEWLNGFHSWAAEPAQDYLRQNIMQNDSMRELKHSITYESFKEILENFPTVLAKNQAAFESVREMARKEFEELSSQDSSHIIHGDFWSGNVLVHLDARRRAISSKQPHLYIIDWEFAQIGLRAFNLGQMIGDLFELHHFHGGCALWIMQGFIAGYGSLSDDLAFRTAIHTGVHLLGWYNRRNPASPLFGSPSQIADAVTLGTELILKGWRRDRAWFEGSVWAGLFKPRIRG